MNANAHKSHFEFIGSRIVNVEINHTYIAMDINNSKSREFELHHEIGEIFDNGEKQFGNIKLMVDVHVENKNNSEDYYTFKMTIEGCFSIEKSFPVEQFKEMLRINGSAALYSIARGFILGVSAQTMFNGQIVLPLLNFTDMPNQSTESQAETEELNPEC